MTVYHFVISLQLSKIKKVIWLSANKEIKANLLLKNKLLWGELFLIFLELSSIVLYKVLPIFEDIAILLFQRKKM
jgi:hypothetical protein